MQHANIKSVFLNGGSGVMREILKRAGAYVLFLIGLLLFVYVCLLFSFPWASYKYSKRENPYILLCWLTIIVSIVLAAIMWLFSLKRKK